MLENSFGLGFFLKRTNNESKNGIVYLRITADGMPLSIKFSLFYISLELIFFYAEMSNFYF